jgi:D-cysteine desulfhydrase family pyridoxal phosphate-dependent enzyme
MRADGDDAGRAAGTARCAARVRLAHLPTPLDPAPRLSEALDGPAIWIKRDDMTGLAFGGNKTRQLEFVFADIEAQGCDVVIGSAYTQSNWCRQMTAAARRLGLDIHLVLLPGEKGSRLQGNLLLDRLMGAEIEIVQLDTLEKVQALLDLKAAALRAAGRRPYVVAPLGLDSLVLGAFGYVAAALEFDRQLEEAQLQIDHLYLAGANMTPAGLALGFKALGRRLQIHNIAPIRWSEPREVDIARIANATAERLGLHVRLEPGEIDNYDDYIGPRYGLVTGACRDALRLVARTEGLILDPVYSGKAMAALVDHVREGRIAKGDRVAFLHTGGTPALFAYAEDLELEPAGATAR